MNTLTHVVAPILVAPILAQWKFGINDPSFIAWLICGVYFVAAGLCWRARDAAVSPATPQSRTLWTLLSLSLVVLGFNKQLDLHQLAAIAAKDLVAARHDVPQWLLAVVGLCVAVAGLALTWLVVKRYARALVDLRWELGIFVSLLVLQVLRFLPGPISKLLLAHVITEEEGVLHIHIIELFELAGLVAISYRAWARSRGDVNRTAPDTA